MKSSLEVVAPDVIYRKTLGMITIDNGNIAYHSVFLENPQQVFITRPIPKTQTTLNTPIVEAKEDLIVNDLVFNNSNLIIDLMSSKCTFYQQDVIELKENVYQYQWIGISNSTEEIDSENSSFSGDFNSNFEFLWEIIRIS
jgi:hypothetical protein